MAMKLTLWQGDPAGKDPIATRLSDEVSLPALPDVGEPNRTTDVQLIPIEPQAGVIAALLVPDGCPRDVRRNGIGVAAGIHLLAHADAIEVDGQRVWVAVELSPDFERYDADRHGADVFCCMTSTRINVDDEIVVCCGTPEQSCKNISRRQAWDRALAAGKPLKCSGCHFDPALPSWRPVVQQNSETLERLFAMIAGNSQREGISA